MQNPLKLIGREFGKEHSIDLFFKGVKLSINKVNNWKVNWKILWIEAKLVIEIAGKCKVRPKKIAQSPI